MIKNLNLKKKYLKEFKILKRILLSGKKKKKEILALNKKYGPIPAKAFQEERRF